MEKIIPQSIHKVVGNELTAGQIAKKFIDATRNMPKSSEREQLKLLSKQFSDLVELRNRIVHGKPCTSPNKQQRLSSNGIIELIDLENAADDFSECANKLNSLFYGFLSE
nr:HEPN domain-containing protein [Shewanella sp. Isolate8]